ncbi:unnamed protein product [Paramecium sonneborni]|uniref:Uncharacterized protein n=1 Tax=Paramecium sonneborni TaxID=65129 RepID=A0A8S1NC26_9CILI|nr:unnamed protein product [Paramecium sonneborni]
MQHDGKVIYKFKKYSKEVSKFASSGFLYVTGSRRKFKKQLIISDLDIRNPGFKLNFFDIQILLQDQRQIRKHKFYINKYSSDLNSHWFQQQCSLNIQFIKEFICRIINRFFMISICCAFNQTGDKIIVVNNYKTFSIFQFYPI